MEGIGTLDMEAGIFYGTLRDGSHVSSMCVMEESSMATSLLFALLEVEAEGDAAQKELDLAANLYPNTPKGKYGSLKPKQRKQVQARLYDVLYKTIEYPYMPQNSKLNMAIGETLARAISSGSLPPPKNDPNIIRDILLQAVMDAIQDEIEAARP